MINTTVFSSVSLCSVVSDILSNLLEDLDAIIFIINTTIQMSLPYEKINLAKLYYESITDFDNPNYEDNIF